ncbi:hypothetical protein [Salisediminibacterium selenitireducens]|uniref:Citrate transporter n=1 Tax=Bacillus selenitireducens (strain ATCC 700615 / DSM 15326 / MLS10) TaxID=439292 RepID=D6XZP3_BACIE|nr:hypothetical protein [Salisediminibacterium selenitireducens]ADH98417.1 hypothetical protein Bsel_0894 [[Bacillus] selenitireducens MLS10]
MNQHRPDWRRYFYILYGSLFAVFLINFFLEIPVVDVLLGWAAVIILVISWFFAGKLFRIIGVLFGFGGIVMSLTGGVPWYDIPAQTGSMLPMLVFLSVLPLMSTAFNAGGYDKRLSDVLHTDHNRLSSVYGRSLLATYVLLIFIHLSAIYVTQNLLKEKLSGIHVDIRNSFILQTTLRAFALAVIWTPMEIIVGIAIDATGVSYLAYLPWLLLISFIATVLDILISRRKFENTTIEQEPVRVPKKALYRSLAKLLLVLTLFLTIIIVVTDLTDISFIMAVALIIVPFAFLWSLAMKQPGYFLTEGWRSWKRHTNGLQNFVVLFLSLPLFSEGFNQTAAPLLLRDLLDRVSDYPLAVFAFIILVYFFLAMIGVHPIATIAILIEIIRPLFVFMNPMSLGIVLIVAAMATTSSAPYGLNATLTAHSLRINPYRITQGNFRFSMMINAVAVMIAWLLL